MSESRSPTPQPLKKSKGSLRALPILQCGFGQRSIESRRKKKGVFAVKEGGVNNPNFGKKLPDAIKEKAQHRLAALNRTKSNKPGTLVEVTNITTNITTNFSSIRKAAAGIPCCYNYLLKYQIKYLSNINTDKTMPLFKKIYSLKFIKP